jgi:hypothetical protein
MEDKQASQLVEPFDLDHGSIKGATLEYAFALGAGWQLFRQGLK